jgi:hypothetical protein
MGSRDLARWPGQRGEASPAPALGGRGSCLLRIVPPADGPKLAALRPDPATFPCSRSRTLPAMTDRANPVVADAEFALEVCIAINLIRAI